MIFTRFYLLNQIVSNVKSQDQPIEIRNIFSRTKFKMRMQINYCMQKKVLENVTNYLMHMTRYLWKLIIYERGKS